MFLIADPTHRQGAFAPAIVLYDEPLDEPVPQNEPSAHDWMLRGFARSYRDFEVLRAAERISLIGARGTASESRYLHELDDGRSWQLRVRSVVVFRPPRVHTFHLADRDDQPSIPRATFEGFIRTITYRNA